MKQNQPPQRTSSPTGVIIDNNLSMCLHSKGRKRLPWEMFLLTVFGTLCMLFTFLSMFPITCHIGFLTVLTILMLFFFAMHSANPNSSHFTLMLFLPVSATFMYVKMTDLTMGMLHILNYIYQTIYMNDWNYFTTDPDYDPTLCVTMMLCFFMVHISWLLTYAVIRYKNFFLSMLLTFPLVEVGFFFGIAPDHLPTAGLIAFWCGMAAVQLSSGRGSYRLQSRTGFLRRRNLFAPVPSMRFLLTEHAGICAACLVFLLCMVTDGALQAFSYKRPSAVKEMRTSFQYYAASIEWSDLSTVFPFLDDHRPDEPDDTIELGRSDRREFQNKVMSRITLTQRPQGRIYLHFSTYDTYGRTKWKQTAQMPGEMSSMFRDLSFYPPEFLFYTAQSLGFERAEMTLENADGALARCVPYGCEQNNALFFRDDLVVGTKTNTYTVFCGSNYEDLLLGTMSYPVTAQSQLSMCTPEDQDALSDYVSGREDAIVQLPQSVALGPVYYGGEEGLAKRSKAAVLSAAGYTDYVFEQYTAVPDDEDIKDVAWYFKDLFEGFDARSASASDTILMLDRLRERLCASVEYSLTPGRTPPGDDYIHYFVIENQKGYCSHYASAGTMLARMAGIPARYCDGYLIDPASFREETADGETVYTMELLDSSAHAWTEVYIDGFGWIPFEFTYSYFTPPELPSEPPTEETTLADDPTEVPSEETLAETETEVVPVPPVPQETQLYTQPVPVEMEEHLDLRGLYTLLSICVVLAVLLTGLFLWRRAVLQKRELKLADPIGDAAAAYAWSLFLSLTARCGVNIQAGSTDALTSEIHAKCGHLLPSEELDEMIRVGTKLRYSPRSLSDPERIMLINTYRKLSVNYYNAANPWLRLWLKWIRHIV